MVESIRAYPFQTIAASIYFIETSPRTGCRASICSTRNYCFVFCSPTQNRTLGQSQAGESWAFSLSVVETLVGRDNFGL
jgi:hypothetical protein